MRAHIHRGDPIIGITFLINYMFISNCIYLSKIKTNIKKKIKIKKRKEKDNYDF